jgi:multiple sugar transport system substrate-binding protein
MTKSAKAIIAASLLLILCIIFVLPGAIRKAHNKDELSTLRILAPTWISEKFKLSEAVEQFAEENPGYKVIVEKYTNLDSSYYPLMNKSLQNKYDIVLGGSREHIVVFAASGTIINFDTGFFDDDLRKEDFFPSFLELGNINGNQYMIPLMGELMSIVIRKDLFREAGLSNPDGSPIPPKDWEQLYSYARRLTTVNDKGEKIYGLNIDFGNNMLLDSFYASLQSKRGNIFDNTTSFIDMSSDDVKYILDMWRRLVKDGLSPTYTFEDLDAGRNNFKDGTIAMLLTPHSRWTEASEALGAEKVGILPLPNAEKNGSLTYIHGITIPSNSPNKELAFKFIKTELLSRDFQAWTMERYGKIPSLIRNYESGLSPEWNSILLWVRNATTLPIYKDWPKIDKTLQLEIQKCITGKQTSEQTVDNIEKQLENVEKTSGF